MKPIRVPPLFGTCPIHVQDARETAAQEKAAEKKAAQEKAAREQALSLTCTCPLGRMCGATLHSLAWTSAIKPEPLPTDCAMVEALTCTCSVITSYTQQM